MGQQENQQQPIGHIGSRYNDRNEPQNIFIIISTICFEVQVPLESHEPGFLTITSIVDPAYTSSVGRKYRVKHALIKVAVLNQQDISLFVNWACALILYNL
jgi:hypothetical protein